MISVKEYVKLYNTRRNFIYKKGAEGVVIKDGEYWVNLTHLLKLRKKYSKKIIVAQQYYFYWTYCLNRSVNELSHELEKKSDLAYTNWNSFLQASLWEQTEAPPHVVKQSNRLDIMLEILDKEIPKYHLENKGDKEYLKRLEETKEMYD